MKFYYLPHTYGFLSLSKNHKIVYNETQTATLKNQFIDADYINIASHYQKMTEIQYAIHYYQENKNNTFPERLFPGLHWIIK